MPPDRRRHPQQSGVVLSGRGRLLGHVSVADGLVYVGGHDGGFTAWTPNGNPYWVHRRRRADLGSTLVADGKVLWERSAAFLDSEARQNAHGASPIAMPDPSARPRGGQRTLYVATFGELYAIEDRAAQLGWRWKACGRSRRRKGGRGEESRGGQEGGRSKDDSAPKPEPKPETPPHRHRSPNRPCSKGNPNRRHLKSPILPAPKPVDAARTGAEARTAPAPRRNPNQRPTQSPSPHRPLSPRRNRNRRRLQNPSRHRQPRQSRDGVTRVHFAEVRTHEQIAYHLLYGDTQFQRSNSTPVAFARSVAARWIAGRIRRVGSWSVLRASTTHMSKPFPVWKGVMTQVPCPGVWDKKDPLRGGKLMDGELTAARISRGSAMGFPAERSLRIRPGSSPIARARSRRSYKRLSRYSR